jgi:steroid delta-isomerase-like uncharacterized protein
MRNEDIIATWYEEVWNKKNEDAIDRLLSEDCIAHGLLDEDSNEIVGAAKFKQLFRKFIASFPDMHATILDTVSEGEKIAVRAVMRCTHCGEAFEAYEGKTISVPGGEKKIIEIPVMGITLIRDGRIYEAWNHVDFLAFYAQLGVLG